MSSKRVASSQSSSPLYLNKQTNKKSSSPGHRLPETNKRPGVVISSLCSGAETGQAGIRTLTSGRVTTSLPAWLSCTRQPTSHEALHIRPPALVDWIEDALDALDDVKIEDANDGAIKASTLDTLDALDANENKDALDALDDGLIEDANDGAIKASALDTLDALDAPGLPTTAAASTGVSMYSDYLVCTVV